MIHIYIESKNDKTPEYIFIHTLLTQIHGTDYKERFKIFPVNGKDNLSNVSPFLIENELEEGINLIVFDADTPLNGGGFATRKQFLQEEKMRLNIQFELFLFPNHADDGDFEYLLEQIINPDHQTIIDCFSDFEVCLRRPKDHNGDPLYVTPNRKGKIFTYISSMNLPSNKRNKLGGGEWLFNDPKYWLLDHPYLKPLIEFLKKHK